MENSSLSTALEYRPQEFKDVIGQDAIVKTLSNAIENQNIPQALLFCAPRPRWGQWSPYKRVWPHR
jgi:DNA polymerase III gamma/tau subunit